MCVLMRGSFGVPSVFDGDRLFIVCMDVVLCVCERCLNLVGYAKRNSNRSAHIML